MSSKSQVAFIPWDPKSALHRQRLVEQRVQCGWDQEKVETVWKEDHLEGMKCVFWIVIPPEDQESDEKVKRHLSMYPKESEMLQDTADYVNAVARTAPAHLFVPIGHISLDRRNKEAEHLELGLPSDGVFWIKTLYVSHALQSQGIGRAAMDEAERMAIGEPLWAKTLMVDTVQKDDQKRTWEEVFGLTSKVSNQEWYTRRGYRLIKIVHDYYLEGTRTVFMKRDIS